MEDHMTSSDMAATGSSSVPMVTGSMGADPDLQVLCDRVKFLEQNAGSTIQPDGYLRNRIRALERSEKSLLLQLYQLASASHLPSMQHSQRLDQRLHMLREEVRTMTQEKERGERIWRERLQRCQRQLKAKEEEMSRQSQYFENYKAQLQHKLSLARDREQSLQNRIYTLEKQLLDMTVSAATGAATISAVRITAGTLWEEQDRLLSMRGEGEGEEEKREERRKQWQPNIGTEREGRREGDEGKTEKEGDRDTKQNSNEARLQGFILSLQEDLRVLLEREESGMTERRRLMEQLQEAQENSHFLCCKVEEMKAEVQQLKLSESSLMEEAEELREENHILQQSLRDATNQTPSRSPTILESTCPSPGTSSLSFSPVVCSVSSNTNATGRYSDESCGKVQLILDAGEVQPHSSAVAPVHHQASAESTQNDTEDLPSPVKPETLPSTEIDSLKRFTHLASKSNLSLQLLSVTTETVDECKLGTLCSRGVLNPEETPSEESDALREAYRSLGLGEDLEALQEQRDRLEAALQHMQEQLQVMAQDNAELKSQLRKQAEEQETETSPAQGNTIPAQDDLVQALNQENRALADRIQELLAHIELREREMKTEQTQLGEHIFRLKEDRARLEEENQEQGCLITELTRKTEDDLNTIMELQQKLVESEECKEGSQVDKELCGSQWQSQHTAEISGSFQQNNPEECVDSLVDSVLKGEDETQLMSSQQPVNLITASAPDFQHNKHNDSLQNSPRSNLHVSSLTDEVDRLTKSVHNLKTEQEELIGKINSLREEQGEVALSVQTQTEEKQHLTRTVWGLKEEKDRVSQSLVALKQDKEHLTRTICGLKDERDQFIRSMKSLKEEKEQLNTCLSGLEREKEKVLESLSSGKEDGDQTVQSLQRLQKESDQLSQTVLSLKLERDELTGSLKRLTEQRDQEQLSSILQEGRDKLLKSVSTLKEEKERIEHSVSCLKQEEKQTMRLLQGIREERHSLQTGFHSQTQTQERNQKHLLNQNSVGVAKKTETIVSGDYAAHRCQTDNYKGNSIQEQSDLMREIEGLGAELKRSQEEVDKSHTESKRLHGELCQSEVRREEAERRAAQAADEVMRLKDEANQMEETSKENDLLRAQVKELQSKLTGLVREKSNALSLKAQIEERYNILTAQLKAKTVALEELNSEYIALKRGQGSRDDLSTVLVSLRTRYNDIRAKYDALLKKKSQTDVDVAPLKAKLSCLVVKCQERNSLLGQMMKVMHKHGCVDSPLTQQVEQLLSDAALQDYTAAFTPGGTVKTQNYSSGFTPGFILKFQDYSSGFTPDPTCFAAIPPLNQHQNGFTTESGVKCGKSEKQSSIVTTEFTTNLQDCSGDIIPSPTAKKNANSTVPTSPVPEHANVPVSPSPVPAKKEGMRSNTTQLSPSASGPEKLGFHHPGTKAPSSPDPTSSSGARSGSSLSPAPPSSATRVSLSRRLSSPEKIISLHEQLQKTLLSSYQAPVSRGRGEQPRKSLSFSAPADLSPSPQIKTQSLSVNIPPTNHLPLTSASSQAKHTTVAKPVATNNSTTLFNAVASRSANVSFSPTAFTKHHLKADISTTTSVLSSSSNSNKEVSTLSGGTNVLISPKLKSRTTAIPDAKHTATTVRSAATDSNVLIFLDTNPKTTASDTSAPSISTAPKANIFSMTSNTDGAAPAYDGLVFTSSCTQSAHRSPERSSESARKSPAAPEKTKTPRPKPKAPADVRSVEVIKTVGQSSLMIGWERPPLDELGCSNGTFVYGYRVFVDGDFHKSVMSSACTKCILENVDLSVPLHISIQTLGSNGLTSNCVHTMYRTSVSTDHY